MLGVHGKLSKHINKHSVFGKEEQDQNFIKDELDEIKEKGY